MSSTAIVQKLWNYCNVLRDDGMSYVDYVEQLTYVLFLKMADERTKPPYNQPSPIPDKDSWQNLLKNDGDELFAHSLHGLKSLGKDIGEGETGRRTSQCCPTMNLTRIIPASIPSASRL